jgi:hypothetical protein
MKNLTTNYNLTNATNRVVKWEIGRPTDMDDLSPPTLIVPVTLYTEGTKAFPISPFVLYIRDAVPSEVLIVDSAATALLREFRINSQTLAGTPYTTLVTAMYAATGKANMRRAVEDLLVAVGALPAVLAGT